MFSVVNMYLDHLKLRVLMVDGMSLVVNVMLSLMIVRSPLPALCDLSISTVVKLCTFVVFALGLYLDEISLTFTAESVCLCGVCSHVSVFGVVLVPYVDAVVVVTVMRVLLFVLHVCMLRECEGVMVTVMLVCGMEVW